MTRVNFINIVEKNFDRLDLTLTIWEQMFNGFDNHDTLQAMHFDTLVEWVAEDVDDDFWNLHGYKGIAKIIRSVWNYEERFDECYTEALDEYEHDLDEWAEERKSW